MPSYYKCLYTTSIVYNHSSPNGREINSKGRGADEQSVLTYIASIVGASSCPWYNFFGIGSLKVGVTLLTSTARLYIDGPNPTAAQATDAVSASTSSETPTRTRDGGSTFAVSEQRSPAGSSAGNAVVIAGQTLTPGGNIVVAGQTISLAPGGQGVVIGSLTESVHGNGGLC
ncbi:hypothetical protein BDZ45DRAFT_807232 [Acephala macrosclerotiorum]|nr:hypothetical protein BDZ45DRAFT_807232 [Acephala macrosclerotiorum]